MSTNKTDYIILGIKMEYSEYNSRFNPDDDWCIHEEYFNSKINDLIVVKDGMSGKYVVIGKLIDKSEEYEGLSMNTINKDIFKDKKLIKNMQNIFGFEESEIKLNILVFSHYH